MTHISTEQSTFIYNVKMHSIAQNSIAVGSNINDTPDDDVFTKRGRQTDYSIDAWVQANDGPNKFRFILDYRITEVGGDHTQLQCVSMFDFEIPVFATNAYIGRAGAMNAKFYNRSTGQLQNWSNITGAPGLAGTYLTEVWRKIDGPGSDTKFGNAGIMASVRIPIEYDLPDTHSFHFMAENVTTKPVTTTLHGRWKPDGSVEKLSPEIDPELQKLRLSMQQAK